MMKNVIIVFAITLSIMFFSISIHNLAAQNVTTNASNVTGNLTASNVTGNLTGFANQLTELSQKLSFAINETNRTTETENSSLNQSVNNSSNLEVKMLNKTGETTK